MSGNSPLQSLADLVNVLQRRIADLEHRLDAIKPIATTAPFKPGRNIDIEGHNIINANVIATNIVSMPQARINKIVPQVLTPPQTNRDLLVGLAPSSIITVPPNTITVGSVYRLGMAGTLTANPGETASIQLGTVSGGVFATMPIMASGTLSDNSFIVQLNMTFNTMTTFNADGAFQSYDPAGNIVAGGLSYQNVPFNSLAPQTFTLTYTTTNFTRIAVNQVQLQRLA